MAFSDWGWKDWAALIGGAASANKDSKDAQDPRDMFNTLNPDIQSPFYNVESDWNRGDPRSNVAFSPEMQPLFDAMMASVGSPVEKRELSGGQKELQNANMNWQRARYGLDPIAYQAQDPAPAGQIPPPDATPPDIVNPADNIYPDGGSANNSAIGRGAGQGSNEAAFQDIMDFVNNRGLADGSLIDNMFAGGGGSGSGGGSGGSFWDWAGKNLGFDPRDSYNASDIDKLFGRGDIGDAANPTGSGTDTDQLNMWENLGNAGSVVGALTGIPLVGTAAGKYGDMQIRDRAARGGWQNPVNPDDPYRQEGSGINLIRDALVPEQSGMGAGNTNPAMRDMMFGRSGFGSNPYTSQTPNITPSQTPQERYADPSMSFMGGRPSGGRGASGYGGGGTGSAGRGWGFGLRASRIT